MNFADAVREAVLERIQDGRYPAEEWLTEKTILEDLKRDDPDTFAGVSSGPVREALIVLEAEEHVQVRPRVGAQVRKVSEADVFELLHNRSALEEFVVSQLAAMREDKVDLTPSRRANGQLGELVRRTAATPDEPVDADTRREVIRLDGEFHGGLAVAAGFPHMAETLRRFRDRIAVFSGTRMTLTGEHLRQFHEEHAAILAALHPDGEFRPDVNDARNAVRRHLRNSARRWLLRPDGLAQDKQHWDKILDLPDYPRSEPGVEQDPFALLAARVSLELLALKRLAASPSVRLDAPGELHREMIDLHTRFETTPQGAAGADVRSGLITRFLNADLGLHVALMFLSGLQFAEEAVIHFWQRFYRHTKKALQQDGESRGRGNRMKQVIQEHSRLLTAIRPGVHQEGDGTEVARCYLDHLLEAVRHTYRGPERDDLRGRLIKLGSLLEPSWKPRGGRSKKGRAITAR